MKKFSKEKKISFMATWDDSESSEAETEAEDERANIAVRANILEETDTSKYE